jgi:hypothetical protein
MDEPRMDDEPLPSLERCAAHNLTVGPDGECVLCRRERTGPPARSAWLVPGIVAAGLATVLLGGVALARTRTPPPPVVDARPVEAPVAAPVEEPAEAPPALPGVVELAQRDPAPAPPAKTAEPQRNYLDEAYAAMDKKGLYDNPRPQQAQTGRSCRTAATGPRYYMRGGSLVGVAMPGQSGVTINNAPTQAAAAPSRFGHH